MFKIEEKNIETKSNDQHKDIEIFKYLKDPSYKPSILFKSGINKELLEGEVISSPTCEISSNKAQNILKEKAFQEFYRDIINSDNSSQYNLVSEINAINYIYGKFDYYKKKWLVIRNLYLEEIGEKKKREKEKRRRYKHLKSQQKENQQKLVLGNGNLEEGTKRFNERMNRQKNIKLNKVNNVSLDLERKFLEFINSDEGKNYCNPVICGAPKQFSKLYLTDNSFIVNKIRLKVQTKNGLNKMLKKLSEHVDSNKLIIDCTFQWNPDIAFSNPSSFSYIKDDGISTLNNSDRLSQGDKVRLIGYTYTDNQNFVVSNEECKLFRLFPKEFEKLEYRNMKTESKMHILYNSDNNLSRLHVRKINNNNIFETEMFIDVLYNGSDDIDPLVIFESPKLNELKNISKVMIEKKIIDLENKKNKAKQIGLSKKNNKDNSIIKLYEMFTNNLLTESEFKKLKNKFL